MASDSADEALSRNVISFALRLGDPIHSTEIGAIEKRRNGPIFWRTFRLRKSRRSLYGIWVRPEILCKWSNLSEEHISEYGGNHRLFQDPAKERPPKAPEMHGPQPISLDAEGSGLPVSNMADASELYPSSAEDSEPEYVDPQIPAISPRRKCGILKKTRRRTFCEYKASSSVGENVRQCYEKYSA
jgi:hypothetical protein